MILWLTKAIGWKYLVVGAATALAGERLLRPALVTLAKGGLVVSDAAARAVVEAKEGASGILKEAAAAAPTSAATTEIAALRAELAELKAKLGA